MDFNAFVDSIKSSAITSSSFTPAEKTLMENLWNTLSRNIPLSKQIGILDNYSDGIELLKTVYESFSGEQPNFLKKLLAKRTGLDNLSQSFGEEDIL